MKINRYQLSGGGTVSVFSPFGDEFRVALVEQDGRYPEEGSAAINRCREEASVVLEGRFEYQLGSETRTLEVGDHITVGSDVPYVITGSGKVMVMVRDGTGGATEIVRI